MTRDGKLSRYRALRAISKHQQNEALNLVSPTTMMEHARRLGLAHGRQIIVEDPDDMTLACDLAVHSSTGGRSRAIDRFASKHPYPEGSDEALVLAAARRAQFTLWVVERRHDVLGLHIADACTDQCHWLIDEGLEASARPGTLFASRLVVVDDFVMTTGAVVPVDEMMVEDALESLPSRSTASLEAFVRDPRFALAMFRSAIHTGAMNDVRFIDAGSESLVEAMRGSGARSD
ncbi:MAG: hypothetical protein WDN25_07020 [Acetobacteraceae bacterium]